MLHSSALDEPERKERPESSAAVAITSSDQPLAVSVASGCHEYVVKASLGTDPGLTARRIESYVCARVYNGR